MLSSITAPMFVQPERDAAAMRLASGHTSEQLAGVSRKVVVLLVSLESNAELRAWAQASGFDLSSDYGGAPRDPAAFEFHVTLLATVDPCDIPETEHAIEPLVVYADGFKVLGTDRRFPCLSIDVEADDFGRVASMRRHYIDTYDAEPTFTEFVPHVSLSYAWDGAPALEDLAVPGIPIVLDRIRVKSLDDGKKSMDMKSANPGAINIDVTPYVSAVSALQAQFAAWGALVDRYQELTDEYYASTDDPDRIRQIIAECRQIQQQAVPFQQANQALVDAVSLAADAVTEAISANSVEITDFYDLDYEQEYLSPDNVIADVDDQVEEMEIWLAENSGGAEKPKSRKSRGLGRRAATKSFLADFDQSIVDALMQAEGGQEVWAQYQAVAAQIDEVDAEIGRIADAMENVKQLAEQMLALRSLGGTAPTPEDRAEAFARFDELQAERDVWAANKEALLRQAAALETDILRLVS